MNPLLQLRGQGQSVWLDFISRDLMHSGQLKRLILEDGLSGLTSNPTIFEKAISKGSDYDEDLKSRPDKSPAEVFETIAVSDIQRAADLFRPTYEKSKGEDGYVSIEVSPKLAYDTEETVGEARRLWQRVGRPNVMVKVPGTREGLPAIRKLLGEGININVTLLFSVARYAEVQEAFLSGLEDLAKRGGDLSKIASVASFFVSRVDSDLDPIFEERIQRAGQDSERSVYRNLLGRIAVANAKLAYQKFKVAFKGSRFVALQAKGARVQRVLFGSTSTKNPAYRDVLYIEELVGAQTINTMPLETLEAFRDHGKVRESLTEDLEGARRTIDKLANYQIDFTQVTDRLEKEGVQKFTDSFENLLKSIESKRKVLV